jgi:hypothetical protein
MSTVESMLTPEEEAAIAGAEAQAELLDRLRADLGLDGWWLGPDEQRHTPLDLGVLLAGDYEPPQMLVEGWLVKGVLHLLYSDAEAGKTWLALKLALDVIRTGERVLWIDEELGPRDLTERLRALGATPEEIKTQLVYLAFPDWTMHPTDVLSWHALISAMANNPRKLGLVVIDTVTDALANAGLDENSGVEVTSWIKTYPEAATMHGVTTLLLDHVGKSEGGAPRHAVGSRAKRAKAKVQLALSLPKPARDYYNATRLGRIRVTLTKNTLGAEIERVRELTIGGDGTGQFIIGPRTAVDAYGDDDVEDTPGKIVVPAEQRALNVLRDAGEPLSTNAVVARMTGRRTDILNALRSLAESEARVRAIPGPRQSTLYEYILDDAVPLANVGAPDERHTT